MCGDRSTLVLFLHHVGPDDLATSTLNLLIDLAHKVLGYMRFFLAGTGGVLERRGIEEYSRDAPPPVCKPHLIHHSWEYGSSPVLSF